MNTIITPTGSYNWVFMIKFELQMGYKPSATKWSEITNHKPVTDNSVILNAVNALLTSAGFNEDELNVALDAIKNAYREY